MLRCADHALRAGAAHGFNKYFAEEPVRKLQQHEERQCVDARHLTPSVQAARPSLVRASGIIDLRTGKRRLDQLFCPAKRQRLHVRCDRGTLGWQQWFPLYAATHIVGSCWYDEPHMTWDTDKNCCTKAGLGRLPSALQVRWNLEY